MKISDAELKQEIIEQLAQLPIYYSNRTGTQHTIRCQACGDSQTLSHAHLSIRINVDDDLPMVYRCFRCNDSGIVTREMLLEWGVSLDSDELSSLLVYNKKSKKKHRNLFSDTFEDYFAPSIDPSLLDEMKREYINTRLGTDFSSDDLRRLKIVTSIESFISANHVKPDLPVIMRKQLESNYVGFLSTNNNRIMCRNIKPSLDDHEFRWYNVILNSNNMNPYTFYSIPNSINLYYTDKINIHIAEGAFDILSIYENLKHGDLDHNYFYASCGSSGLNIMNFLIDRGINTGINLHLYADKDKSDDFHMKYLMYDSEVYQWCDSIIIHRNKMNGEKDYGVPKDRIKDSFRTVYKK